MVHRPQPNDDPFDGSRCAVCELYKLCLGIGSRRSFCAEGAKKKKDRAQGYERDSMRVMSGKQAQDAAEQEPDEQQRGHQPDKTCNRDTARKAYSCKQEWKEIESQWFRDGRERRGLCRCPRHGRPSSPQQDAGRPSEATAP